MTADEIEENETVEWLQPSAAAFWGSVWSAAFICCLVQTCSNDNFVNLRVSVGASSSAGVIGCAVAFIIVTWCPDLPFIGVGCVIASALVGCGGKKLQQALMNKIVKEGLKKIGLSLDDEPDLPQKKRK